MVVIEQYNSSQFGFLQNTKARVLYDSTINEIRYHNNTNYNNILLSKDNSNNVTGINDVSITGSLDIANYNGVDIGLKLNGVLLLASATQMNYNDVTPGVGTALKSVVLDEDRNIMNMNKINTTGNVGINTSASLFGLEVNHSSGNCLRLSYNDSDGSYERRCDLVVTPTGSLSINPGGANPSVVVGGNLSSVSLSATKQNVSDVTVDFPLSLTVLPDNAGNIGLGTGIEFNSLNDDYTIFSLGTMEFYTTDPTNLHEESNFRMRLSHDGEWATAMHLTSDGILSSTSFIETSDIRMKENIKDTIIIDSVEKVLKLDVKSYNYKKDLNKRHRTGLIAQEVLEIMPELVVLSKVEEMDDFHQLHYSGIIPHLINCIKDLYKEMDELKKINLELNNKINNINN
jgi:hypothetical protein